MKHSDELRKQRETFLRRIPAALEIVARVLWHDRAAFAESDFRTAYLAASYALIGFLVDEATAKRYWVQQADGTMTAGDGNRIVTVGEALFRLTRSECVFEFCRRIRTRDAQTAFYEALIASIFLEYGFDIVAIEESYVRGQDFDFTAIRNGSTICVEVTSFRDAPVFSEKTVKNALRKKASQLPPDKPGVIFCLTPENWFRHEANKPKLAREARRIFGASKRVNMVFYLAEQRDTFPVADGEYELLQFAGIPLLNENARNQTDVLSFLWNFGEQDLSREVGSVGIGELSKEFSKRPFFQWVDNAVGRT